MEVVSNQMKLKDEWYGIVITPDTLDDANLLETLKVLLPDKPWTNENGKSARVQDHDGSLVINRLFPK